MEDLRFDYIFDLQLILMASQRSMKTMKYIITTSVDFDTSKDIPNEITTRWKSTKQLHQNHYERSENLFWKTITS